MIYNSVIHGAYKVRSGNRFRQNILSDRFDIRVNGFEIPDNKEEE